LKHNWLNEIALKIPQPYLATYKAIVKCLGKLHSEAYDFEIVLRETGYGQRTKHYSHALVILTRLLSYDPTEAHKSGLLPWLESYPFGGYDTAEGKKKSIDLLLSLYYHAEPMYTILLRAFLNESIGNVLRKCDWINQNAVRACDRAQDYGTMYYDAIMHHPNRYREVSWQRRDRELAPHGRGLNVGTPEERLLRSIQREELFIGEAGRRNDVTNEITSI
jgi:hypothetical protein